MIFHHLQNVANLWAKLEIKVTEYIANRPAFDLLPATKVLGVRDPVELYRRTTGKRQTSTTEANQTSSRSIVELKITIGQAMLRIFGES